MKIIHRIAFSLILTSCVFTSEEVFDIKPDLSVGNRWLYIYMQSSKTGNASGDTLKQFGYYEILKDTVVDLENYRVMSAEWLAYTPVLGGHHINKSRNIIKQDMTGIHIKELNGGEQALGFYPLKVAAGTSFDTVKYHDEVTSLVFTAYKDQFWYYRLPNHPSASPVRKKYIGNETIEIFGKYINAYKFQFIVEGLEWLKEYQWYDFEKVIKVSATSDPEPGVDSTSYIWEQLYIGKRYFNQNDSTDVYESSLKW